jgi:site-specific recombinase XerD
VVGIINLFTKEDDMSTSKPTIHKRLEDAMKLHGYSERTREVYLWSIQKLAEHFGGSIEGLEEDHVRKYLLHCQEKRKYAAGTMKIVYSAVRFLYGTVLKRDWDLLPLLRIKSPHRLPTVLTAAEVKTVLSHVGPRSNYVFLFTLYALGLRLSEALELQVHDIDRKRMMVHIRHGKGGKDRYVPLPRKLLALLAQHWLTHRHQTLLFPGTGRYGNNVSHSKCPISKQTIQEAMRRAAAASGINKNRVTPHTLRHSYATHLLEAGASIKSIQHNMGHANVDTTMLYLHMTRRGDDDCRGKIDDMLEVL